MERRSATVLVDSQPAGVLCETDEGYAFTYDDLYLSQPGAKPISLTLPLSAKQYTSKTMFPFFDGLIPEGWLLMHAITTWKLDARDRMGLICAVCRDCIGDVSIEARI
ncbi:MAG: HipA N-terminal domain-containing protein [Sphaerochaeta sp.]|jgi:serine/threonine-protein kinase HipA|nr:HipA N-terminal domain-containing protein [Sphaerochaeta sp.]NLK04902.1 phosphatidylinositol kinase [Spirochaetales bacterium]